MKIGAAAIGCRLLVLFGVLSMAAHAQKQAAPHGSWIEFRSFAYEGTDSLKSHARPGRNEFRNPILAGFYPDPSLVRVGEDYYLVNSSFAWYPGVPIFHSRDLVNWTQIGHVLDRPEQLPLDGVGVSQGIFAPAIRFHNGRFYMITTNVSGGGNFYVTAEKASGPWSKPVYLPEINGIDPSFFFDDDGRTYIIHNGPPPDDKPLYDGHRALWLFPFDVKEGKVSGPGKIVVNAGTDIAKHPKWIEGPHLLKRNGFYYIIAAEGGTEEGHSEVAFRSRSIDGPYEPYAGNPILTQRTLDPSRPDPITSTGHADFVETQNGEWWAVFLGCEPYADNFFNTGRETFLLPVKWVDDWPVILENGKAVPYALQRPKLPESPSTRPLTGPMRWTERFGGEQLPYGFDTLRTPLSKWWRTDSQRGLLLQARSEDLDSKHDPSLVAHRQQHANFSATVEMNLDGLAATSEAGAVAFQNETHWYFLGIRSRATKSAVVFLERQDGARSVVAQAEIGGKANTVELKIEGAGARYRFYFRTHGGTWQQVGGDQDGTVLSTKTAGGFVGAYLGMFARTSSASQKEGSSLE